MRVLSHVGKVTVFEKTSGLRKQNKKPKNKKNAGAALRINAWNK